MYRVVNLHSYLAKNAEHYIFTRKHPAKCENEEQYQSFSKLLKKKIEILHSAHRICNVETFSFASLPRV